jgi:hypothetical protein
MGGIESKRLGQFKFEKNSDIFGTNIIKEKINKIRGVENYPPYFTKKMLIELEKNDLKLFNKYYQQYKLFRPTTKNKVDAILEGIFYPMEQLCNLSDEELYQLLVDREIEEMSEEGLIKYQVSKTINPESQCKTFEDTYSFYSATGHKDINDFIRGISKDLPENFFYPLVGGNRSNIRLLYCIHQMDNMIKNSNKFGDGKTIYYKGIRPPTLIVIESSMKDKKTVKDGDIDFQLLLNDVGFGSVTTDINIAKNFVKGYNCCILMFSIPENIRIVDKTTETHEQETILERNIIYSSFVKRKTIEDTFVIECSIRKFSYPLLDIYNGKNNKIVEFYN